MRIALLVILGGLAGIARPQEPDSFKISVNVHLVLLQVSVQDRDGQLVSGLREQDFSVYEDGALQTIRLFRHEDAPVTVGLIVDHSTSMRSKLMDVVAATRTFVQASSPRDEMFVVNFNDRVSLGLPPRMKFSDRPDDLALAISNTVAGGRTSLYDAILLGQKQMQLSTQDRKALMVISDGGDNASTHRLAEVLDIAEKSNAMIYAIGIFDKEDPDSKPRVLKRLAHATGGEAFFPAEASAVATVCAQIARDIRSQYTLGYVSSNPPKPGARRSIHVNVPSGDRGKRTVRTRPGYVSPDATK